MYTLLILLPILFYSLIVCVRIATLQISPVFGLWNGGVIKISVEDEKVLAKEYQGKSAMSIYIDLNFNKRSHKWSLKRFSIHEVCSEIGISFNDEIERKVQKKWRSVSGLKEATQELYGFDTEEFHPGIPESHYWYWKNEEKEQEKNDRESKKRKM
jgi:hypothetical protein